MRVPVNLASEPFRRDRPMLIASGIVGVLLTGLLCMLIVLAVSERNRAREARGLIERTNAELRTMAAEQARLEGVLRQPANAEVLDRSLFINALLARKGVSWTKIFSDLEGVVPHNVRLISVRPQINGQNDLLLDITVAAQTSEPVENFMMQLESSPLFGTTTVHGSLPPSQSDPNFRYRVSVSYAQKL
jgi:Tfp pilus assembly protein PilN